MKKTLSIITICFAACMLVVTSCKKDKTDEETETPVTPINPTLYEQVGGTTMKTDPTSPSKQIEAGRLALRSVVDSSIYIIAGDTAMTKYFGVLLSEVTTGNTTGFAALSKNFTDFLCVATGATNPAYAYTGKSMKAAHDPASNSRMGLKVNAADFDKFVGDIGKGLVKNGVTSTGSTAQLYADLVKLLYTTKTDIVQR
ncbi:MAG TPA: group 1 truncated hemoglobin [Bacteroidia bacterium]|jgi:hypothetical protein|nr:group 1 truncated hemoglobin [Bacteroidia bacterium]